jgi:hypothetical protein
LQSEGRSNLKSFAMSHVAPVQVMPSVMEAKLRSIRRRQAILAVGRALMLAGSTLLAAMLVAMLLDWSFTLFNGLLRTMLTACAMLLAVIVLTVSGAGPVIAARRWTRAATAADESAPQLEERWTTVASFATVNHRPTSPVAEVMLQQVAREAAALGSFVEPSRAVPSLALRPTLIVFLACCFALAAFLALGGRQSSVLLRRFWSPWAPITATQLRSLTGDVTIPRGEPLELTIGLEGVARSAAVLTVEYDSGVVDAFVLTSTDRLPHRFTHSLRVEDSFRYQVRAGDGQTSWHCVTAIDYPELCEIRLTITAPAYVDRPPLEKTLMPRRVTVVEGSWLVLRMKPQTAVERLQLTLTPGRQDEEKSIDRNVTLTPDKEGWYRWESQLLEDFSFCPSLVNAHGLTNQEKHVCSIEVIADKAPVVRILSPTEETAATVDEQIKIAFEAHDDHAIDTAELVVYDESGAEAGLPPKVVTVKQISLGDQKLKKYVTASTQLDLKELNLEPGAQLSYAIRVTDNRKTTIDPNGENASFAEPGPADSQDDSMLSHADDRTVVPRNKPFGEPASHEIAKGAGGDTHSNAADLHEMLASVAPPLQQRDSVQPNAEVEGAQPANTTGEPSPITLPDKETTPHAQLPPQSVDVIDDNANTPRNSSREAALQLPDKPKKHVEQPNAPSPRAEPDDRENSNEQPKERLTDELGTKLEPEIRKELSERNRDGSSGRTANLDDESNVSLVTRAAKDATDGDQRESDEGDQTVSQVHKGADVTNETGSGEDSQPSSQPVSLTPQQSGSGQNAETNRRRLKITERLTAVAEASDSFGQSKDIRERVVQIDKMLATIETDLARVVDPTIADADRSEQFQNLDAQLGEVETYIAQLHADTRETELAFAGMQMVDIARSHVTPARDRVFVAIRDPAGAETYAADARQQIVRARELLAALLERYDRVNRERALAEALEESVTIYEVYVEKMQRLMREARQNTNPLQRKMAVIKVDQEYLDRYAEVLTMRREMLAEFGRMLADDPRLMARYLDLIKRRRTSLRDQLSELADRQDEIATELNGWLQVDPAQRDDLWTLLVEMRLQATTQLAKDAAELAERIEKQAPLGLDPSQGTAATVIAHAKEIARLARSIAFDAAKQLQNASELMLASPAEQLVTEFSELEAALDLLNFENEDEDEVTTYIAARLLESRTVADQAVGWRSVAQHLEQKHYAGLAEVEQQGIAIATELLRVELLGVQEDLDAEFRQQAESTAPPEIIDLVHELHHVMEGVGMNQAAAIFAMKQSQLEESALQQAKAVEGFERAEELLDRIRRDVIAALDKYEMQDPNVADLVDPTLDEFLAQLEREPNLEAQLGIPARPRNLRVIADTLMWQQSGGDMLNNSGEAAMQRAREAMKKQPSTGGEGKPLERELTDQQREQRENEKDMQDMLAKSLAAMQEKMKDPDLSPEERRRLKQMAESMRGIHEALQPHGPEARSWDELAESDQAKETLRALARGESIPDQQWNKLLSTLEDGLWQVRGKSPPAEYRKAIEQYQDRIRQLMGSGE